MPVTLCIQASRSQEFPRTRKWVRAITLMVSLVRLCLPSLEFLTAQTFKSLGLPRVFWYWKFYDQLSTTEDFL